MYTSNFNGGFQAGSRTLHDCTTLSRSHEISEEQKHSVTAARFLTISIYDTKDAGKNKLVQ